MIMTCFLSDSFRANQVNTSCILSNYNHLLGKHTYTHSLTQITFFFLPQLIIQTVRYGTLTVMSSISLHGGGSLPLGPIEVSHVGLWRWAGTPGAERWALPHVGKRSGPKIAKLHGSWEQLCWNSEMLSQSTNRSCCWEEEEGRKAEDGIILFVLFLT